MEAGWGYIGHARQSERVCGRCAIIILMMRAPGSHVGAILHSEQLPPAPTPWCWRAYIYNSLAMPEWLMVCAWTQPYLRGGVVLVCSCWYDVCVMLYVTDTVAIFGSAQHTSINTLIEGIGLPCCCVLDAVQARAVCRMIWNTSILDLFIHYNYIHSKLRELLDSNL